MEAKKITSKAYYLVLVAIVLAAVVLVNIITNLADIRIDFTEDQRYSLTESTKEVLESDTVLTDRIVFKVYLEGEMPAEAMRLRNAIKGKLDEFKYYAGNKIEYEFIEPVLESEKETKEFQRQLINNGEGILPVQLEYRVKAETNQLDLFPGAVVEYKGITSGYVQFLNYGKSTLDANFEGKIQEAITNIEFKLVEAIDKATRTKKKTLGFLHGHGELEKYNSALLRDKILSSYNIADVSINGKINALDNIDGLVIADPTERFSDKDKFVIDQFLMKGKNLMLFYNPLEVNNDTLRRTGTVHSTRKRTDIEKLSFDYGIRMKEDLIIDANYGFFGLSSDYKRYVKWYYYLFAEGTEHPISSQIDPVILLYSSSLEPVAKKGLKYTPILTSSKNSEATGIAPMLSLGLQQRLGENPALGKIKGGDNRITVGAITEGNFSSSFKNRIIDTYANNPDAKILEESVKPGKFMVISNGNFFANRYYDSTFVAEQGTYTYRARPANQFRGEFEDLMANGVFSLGNFDFAENCIDYMMGESALLAVRSRSIDLHPTDKVKVSTQNGFYKFINILVPLGIIILLALTLIIIRKRKYAK